MLENYRPLPRKAIYRNALINPKSSSNPANTNFRYWYITSKNQQSDLFLVNAKFGGLCELARTVLKNNFNWYIRTQKLYIFTEFHMMFQYVYMWCKFKSVKYISSIIHHFFVLKTLMILSFNFLRYTLHFCYVSHLTVHHHTTTSYSYLTLT